MAHGRATTNAASPRIRDRKAPRPSRPRGVVERIASRPTTLAAPLEMLCFLLPLVAVYELACLFQPQRVIAYTILRQFLSWFGPVGVWAPGLALMAILLATHIASGRPWRVRWRRVALMYVESVIAACPLLLLSWGACLSTAALSAATFGAVAQGLGAGVYEELVFRLILVSTITMLGADLLRRDRATVAVVAILTSAMVFAAHHHAPVGADPFSVPRFAFRTFAGVYLGAIFWYRGLALSAGCHAAYNTLVILSGVLRPA